MRLPSALPFVQIIFSDGLTTTLYSRRRVRPAVERMRGIAEFAIQHSLDCRYPPGAATVTAQFSRGVRRSVSMTDEGAEVIRRRVIEMMTNEEAHRG